MFRRRPFVPLCLSLIAGVLSARAGLELWLVAVGAPLLIGWVAFDHARSGWLATGRALSIMLAAAAGVYSEARHDRSFAPDHVRNFVSRDREPATLEGIVRDEPRFRAAGYRRWTTLTVEARSLARAGGPAAAASGLVRAFVYADEPTAALYGSRIRLRGFISAPPPPANPGMLDTRALLAAERIHATFTAKRPEDLEVLAHGGGSATFRSILEVKARLSAAIRAAVPGDRGALLDSMLLGGRDELDEPVLEAFQRTGTLHLLAISGQHLAIICGLFWFLLARLARLPRRVAIAAVLAIAVGYCLLAGATPSVVRATIMIGVFLLGKLVRREPDTLNSLALAAVVILVLNPGDLANVGFQLSFAAVLGLCLVFPPLREMTLRAAPGLRVRFDSGWLARARLVVVEALLLSVAAWVATAPLILYHFNLVTPGLVLANLVAVPLVWLLLTGGVLLAIVAPLSAAAAAPLGIGCDVAARVLLAVVTVGEKLPGMYFYWPSISVLQVLLAYAAAGAVLVAVRFGARRAALPAGAVLAALAIALPAVVGRGPAAPELRATFLDVGAGSATVLAFGDGRVYLYDCGSSRYLDVGERVVAPILWSRGIRRVDGIFISHAHADHTSGIEAILERFDVAGVYVSTQAGHTRPGRELLADLSARGVPVRALAPDERVVVGEGTYFETLAPAPWAAHKEENDRSLVVRLRVGERSLLLPGDVEEAGTRALLAASAEVGDGLRSDVLLVPHHGGRNDLSEGLARAVAPEVAVVSASADFPVRKTLEAYWGAGAQVLLTASGGAVEVVIDRGAIRTETPGGRWTRPSEELVATGKGGR